MNYTFIDQKDAPARSPERGRRRIAGIDELVEGLTPGKAVRIELNEEEKPRAVTDQLFKTAARTGKLVDVWEVDGIIYAEIVPTAGS